MVNIDATTPQLKVVKNLLDAYSSLDISKVEPFISKDFKYQMFPKIINLPDEPRAAHIQKYGEVLAALTKMEVRVQPRRSAFKLRLISTTLSSPLTR